MSGSEVGSLEYLKALVASDSAIAVEQESLEAKGAASSRGQGLRNNLLSCDLLVRSRISAIQDKLEFLGKGGDRT